MRPSTDGRSSCEGNARVLVHEGKPAPHDSFAVAIFTPLHYRDVQVSVRFKAIAGGRAAGLVWKYQDPLNHYSAQLDLVRQELVMTVWSMATGSVSSARTISSSTRTRGIRSRSFRSTARSARYLGGIRVLSERDHLPLVLQRAWGSGRAATPR